MKTATGAEYRYSREELETIHRYDAVDKAWYTWSNIPKHIQQMKKLGWEVVKEDQYGVKFKAPEHAVKPMPAEKKKRQLTEKQRAALARNRFTSRKARENIAGETSIDAG